MLLDLSEKNETAPQVKTPTAPPIDPEPVPTAPEECSAYPSQHLPEPMASMLAETCRACGLDADIPGPLLLGAISTACGAGLLLEDSDLLTGSNLFLLTTALSGIGKSRAYKEILRPLHSIESERVQLFRDQVLPQVEAERAALDAEQRGILGKIKGGNFDAADRDTWKRRLVEIRKEIAALEKDAIPPGFLVEDITSQSLKLELTRRTFLSIVSPDCGDVIENILGRWNEGKADANPLLQSWQREGMSRNRMNEDSRSEETVSAMVLIGTEDLAEDLFNNKRLKAGGFLARVLFTASKSLVQYDDGKSKVVSPSVAARWRETLSALVENFLDAEEPQIVPTSPSASKLWLDVKNEKAAEINSRYFPSYNARLVEQSKRIALCLHAAQHLHKAPQIELSEDTARAGLAIAGFHLGQILKQLSSSEFDADLAMLRKLKTKAKNDRLSLTEARHKANITPEQIAALIARRPEWLKIEKIPTGGAPLNQIQIL